MKIAVYGNAKSAEEIVRFLTESPGYMLQKLCIATWNRYDDFIGEYPKSGATALFVTADGGEGLKAMTAAGTLAPNTPRAWFAADKSLCTQAMRLGAAFFGPKPLTQDGVTKALCRCSIPENYIELLSVGRDK